MNDTNTTIIQPSLLDGMNEEDRTKWIESVAKVAGENNVNSPFLGMVCEVLHAVVVRLLQQTEPLVPDSDKLTVKNMLLFKKVIEATGKEEEYVPSGMAECILRRPGQFYRLVCSLLEYPDEKFGPYRMALGLLPADDLAESPKKKKGRWGK